MLDGLEYLGVHGGDHVFNGMADGDRPVIVIYVKDSDDDDEQLPIRINGVGNPPDDVQETHGITHMTAEITDDGVTRMPCIKCIAGYMIPRIATMMARVYIPQSKSVKHD